jgi:hypothetical protein
MQILWTMTHCEILNLLSSSAPAECNRKIKHKISKLCFFHLFSRHQWDSMSIESELLASSVQTLEISKCVKSKRNRITSSRSLCRTSEYHMLFLKILCTDSMNLPVFADKLGFWSVHIWKSRQSMQLISKPSSLEFLQISKQFSTNQLNRSSMAYNHNIQHNPYWMCRSFFCVGKCEHQDQIFAQWDVMTEDAHHDTISMLHASKIWIGFHMWIQRSNISSIKSCNFSRFVFSVKFHQCQ